MLLVLVLQQLAQLTISLVTVWAMVGQIGHHYHGIAMVREQRRFGHVRAQDAVTLGELINLGPRLVGGNATAPAIATLDVLYGISTRPKPGVPADGTGDGFGTVHLLVHRQFVLIRKRPLARTALEAGWWWCGIGGVLVSAAAATLNAINASRDAFPLTPLVRGEVARAKILLTIGAVPTHDSSSWRGQSTRESFRFVCSLLSGSIESGVLAARQMISSTKHGVMTPPGD